LKCPPRVVAGYLNELFDCHSSNRRYPFGDVSNKAGLVSLAPMGHRRQVRPVGLEQ
jgi:hypothetical protein